MRFNKKLIICWNFLEQFLYDLLTYIEVSDKSLPRYRQKNIRIHSVPLMQWIFISNYKYRNNYLCTCVSETSPRMIIATTIKFKATAVRIHLFKRTIVFKTHSKQLKLVCWMQDSEMNCSLLSDRSDMLTNVIYHASHYIY